MKRVPLIGVAITMFFGISCKDNKQNVTENSENARPEMEVAQTMGPFFSNDTVTTLFKNYQELQSALVNADDEQVQAIAAKIDKELTADQAALKVVAAAMAQESSIEKQREQFSDLTKEAEPMFKEFLTNGKLYKQFCPMAFEGKGGYWVSPSEDIKNPYYGDKMLTCGRVVEVIQ